MNIFNKITLESMKKSRTRTIVTIIGVILSASMITSIVTFAVSLQKYMINGATQKYGNWHVEFIDVDLSFEKEIVNDAEVTNTAVFENIGYSMLSGSKNPNKPYLFIAGFSEDAFNTLPINLISGKLPQNSDEILVPAHTLTNGGVKLSVGDTLTLSIGNRMRDNKSLNQHDPYNSNTESSKAKEILVSKTKKTYTIVGICERPTFEEYSSPGYTLITKINQAKQTDRLSIFVTLKNPSKVHTYANNTAKNQSFVFNNEVLRFMGLSDDNMFNCLLYSVGSVLIVLIMISSIFLIYNSFDISLSERTRQFGILSSVGATPKQLRNSVLFEGLCIGLIGIPIGIIIGIFSIKFVIFIVAKNFSNILYSSVPLTLTVSAFAIVISVVVSMVTILISAYIPARKAVNTPVMESIRQTNEFKIESKTVKISKFAQRIYGLEGILALKNFKRNKKRYRSIVLSLTLSVALFVSGSAFGTYLKQTAKLSIVDVDYDICFSTEDMNEDEVFALYEKLKNIDGIYKSSYQAILEYSCSVKTHDFSDVYRKFAGYTSLYETDTLSLAIQFIEDSQYQKFIESLGLPLDEYTGENAKMTGVAKVNLYDDKTEKNELLDMFKNRSMTFTIAPKSSNKQMKDYEQNIDITFVDTIPLDTLPRESSSPKSTVFMVVAPYKLKERFEIAGQREELGLTFSSKNPSKSVVQMEEMIKSMSITSQYNISNVYKIFEQNRNIIFVVDVFTYVFVIMISLISIANVFNTISTNIKLRRRELAMLRSIGMSDYDFKKMMNFECIFYGMKTLIIGLPIAGVLSWLIYKGLIASGAKICFTFPWVSIVISILGVFLVVFITMIYTIKKIKRGNIIDALRDDMT